MLPFFENNLKIKKLQIKNYRYHDKYLFTRIVSFNVRIIMLNCKLCAH
jgi:hypothetical protein